MMHKTLTAALAVALSGLGACDTIKAPDIVRQDPLPQGAYPQQVVLEGLNRGIVSGDPVVRGPSDSMPMTVTVPLRSVADKTLHVQYQFEFLDANGLPVRGTPTSGWRFVTVEPRTQVFAVANALDTDAVDWRLQVRPAR